MILFWIVNIFGGFLVALWSNHFFNIIFLFLSWMIQSVYAVLTDAGDEVIEPVLGKQRVLQTPEVELQHSSHRINVMVAFLVNQRIVTCMRGRREKSSNTSLPAYLSHDSRVTFPLTSHLFQTSSWCHWPPLVILIPGICLDAEDLLGTAEGWRLHIVTV